MELAVLVVPTHVRFVLVDMRDRAVERGRFAIVVRCDEQKCDQQNDEKCQECHDVYPSHENKARRCFFLRRTHRRTTHTTFSCNGRSIIFCIDGSARVFLLFGRALPPLSPAGCGHATFFKFVFGGGSWLKKFLKRSIGRRPYLPSRSRGWSAWLRRRWAVLT